MKVRIPKFEAAGTTSLCALEAVRHGHEDVRRCHCIISTTLYSCFNLFRRVVACGEFRI